MGKTLYLHAGLPKTGTTYLQKDCFPYLDGIRYIRRYRSEYASDTADEKERGMDLWKLVRIIKNTFRLSPSAWEAVAGPTLARLSAHSDRDGLLVSHENLAISSRFILFEHDSRHLDPYLFCAHLRTLGQCAIDNGFDRLRVLIMVRRQDAWFASRYAQSGFRLRDGSQSDFVRRTEQLLDSRGARYCQGAWLDYHIVRRELARNLGEENVLMLPYELLESDPEQFFLRLSSFFSVAVNPVVRDNGESVYHARRTARDTWSVRPYETRFFPGLSRRLSRKRRITVTPSLSEKIMSSYEAGNRALADDLELDLSRYGYYTLP